MLEENLVKKVENDTNGDVQPVVIDTLDSSKYLKSDEDSLMMTQKRVVLQKCQMLTLRRETQVVLRKNVEEIVTKVM